MSLFKNKIIQFIISISTLYLISCGDRNIRNDEELLNCKEDVIKYGDVESYIKLTNFFIYDNNYYELLPYSLKMLELKKMAYSDFYITYMRIRFNNIFNNLNFSRLNKEEKLFLLELLKRGVNEGDFECEEILKIIEEKE